MKNLPFPAVALFLLMLLVTGYANAQQRIRRIIYDENNQPSYIEREIIVQFAPSEMRLINIDNPQFQVGYLNDFINDNALE